MAGTCNGYGRQALLRLGIVSTSSGRRRRTLLNFENRHPLRLRLKESSKTLLSLEHRHPFARSQRETFAERHKPPEGHT